MVREGKTEVIAVVIITICNEAQIVPDREFQSNFRRVNHSETFVDIVEGVKDAVLLPSTICTCVDCLGGL